MRLLIFVLTWVVAGLIFGWGWGSAAKLGGHEERTSNKENERA